MNRYLSKTERGLWLVMGAFIPYLDGAITGLLQTKDPDKWILAMLRTAKTKAEKALTTRLAGLEMAEKQKLLREVKQVRISSQSTAEWRQDYERMAKLDSYTHVETDDWLDIAAHCIDGTCKTCELSGEEAEACRIKRVFLKYDIAPYDPSAPVGVCPYKYEKETPLGNVGERMVLAMHGKQT